MERTISEIITSSPEETMDAGKLLGQCLNGGEVIAYKGGLGAGKTTFTRGLAEGLGEGMGECVTSPTFTIVNEYHGGRLSLYHFDMYRISGGEELEAAGFFDLMSEDSVIAAEWSENISEELDGNAIIIEFGFCGDSNERRRITLKAGKGGEKFAHAWDRYLG